MKKITGWYVTQHPNTIERNMWRAPEARYTPNPSIGGYLNGKGVVTSAIKSFDGRTVVTKSGSVYVLDGEPGPELHTFLESIHRKYDETSPLSVLVPDYLKIDEWNGFGGEMN